MVEITHRATRPTSRGDHCRLGGVPADQRIVWSRRARSPPKVQPRPCSASPRLSLQTPSFISAASLSRRRPACSPKLRWPARFDTLQGSEGKRHRGPVSSPPVPAARWRRSGRHRPTARDDLIIEERRKQARRMAPEALDRRYVGYAKPNLGAPSASTNRKAAGRPAAFFLGGNAASRQPSRAGSQMAYAAGQHHRPLVGGLRGP